MSHEQQSGPARMYVVYVPGGAPEGIPYTEGRIEDEIRRLSEEYTNALAAGSAPLLLHVPNLDFDSMIAPRPAESAADRMRAILAGAFGVDFATPRPAPTAEQTLAAIDDLIGPDAFRWSSDMGPEPEWGES
jgi:hypothetical protein